MEKKHPLLVYGSTEFGKVVRELVDSCGYGFAGYIDDWHTGKEIAGTLESTVVSHPPGGFCVVLAIGYKHLQARREIAVRVRDMGYRIPTLVHPRAYVASSASLAPGVMVMANACIDIRARVGPLTVVWPGAIISHDCELVGNTFVSPGAIICGHSHIGEDSFLGAGSVVVDHVAMPGQSFLKAGEVFKGNAAQDKLSQDVAK